MLLIALAIGLLAVLTLLPCVRVDHWLVRGMDFPRLQMALLLTLAVAVALWRLDLSQLLSWVVLLVGGTCLLYQIWWILPYTPLYPREVKTSRPGAGDRLRILTANVLTPNPHCDRLLEIVRACEPDILVTLETDLRWQQALDQLQDEGYCHTIKCPLDNLYGMHVYSRYPLERAEIEFLVEPDKPSMHALVVMPSGERVRAHFLHPAPPSPTENPYATERDAELLVVARSVKDSDLPVVITGDLNDVAWSTTTRAFRRISGLLDPRVGRGMFNTFHAEHWWMRWPLDHLFHSNHFTLVALRRLPAFGSDHFPLFTELRLEPQRRPEQHGLEETAEAHALAAEQSEAMDVEPSDVPHNDV